MWCMVCLILVGVVFRVIELFSDLFILVLLLMLGRWLVLESIFLYLISILWFMVVLNLCISLLVCLIIGNWLLFIGISWFLKVVMLVVWLIGQVRKFVGMLCLKLCRWIFFLMVGLCFRCEIVIRFSSIIDSLQSLCIWDWMKMVDFLGLMFMVRQFSVILSMLLVIFWWWLMLLVMVWVLVSSRNWCEFFCSVMCDLSELMQWFRCRGLVGWLLVRMMGRLLVVGVELVVFEDMVIFDC